VASKGLKKWRDAGLTKVQPNGNEQFYVHSAVPDSQGRRCYCVVAQDMSFNDVVVIYSQICLQNFMAKNMVLKPKNVLHIVN